MKKKLFFLKSDFDLVKNSSLDEVKKLSLISEMVRYNTLVIILIANSGHLGASLSPVEALSVLYHKIMEVSPKDPRKEKRDVFILSKGHAGPTVYSVLASLGYFSEKFLHRYRKLKGLGGHVSLETRGIEANTGSLGMGISKAKGHALAMKKKGLKNKAFVMVGDGELQEGQNWEGLQSAPAFKLGNLVLLVDKNEVQSDKKVDDLLPMPSIEEKLSSFGWKVFKVNGHDIKKLIKIFSSLNYQNKTPKAIILKTIKGKGVSFMEHTKTFKKKGKLYNWHDKVPDEKKFKVALKEVQERIKKLTKDIKTTKRFFPEIETYFKKEKINFAKESVVEGFSRALVKLGKKNKNIVVLDADLAGPCGLKPFEKKYPKRFIEMGIAEQDMVSTAGALAQQGFLPVVNSFAAFLTSRANEQIFNNQTEGKKIIYVGHLAGLLPATPGKSHQSLRDIALMRTMPNLILAEPCNSQEAEEIFNFLVENVNEGAYFRLVIMPGLGEIVLPKNYKVDLGKGAVLKEGKDIALISYGPITLPILLETSKLLAKKGISAKIVNFPWLNRTDFSWFKKELSKIPLWVVVENHITYGGLSEEIKKLIKKHPQLKRVKLESIGINKIARSGQILEILKYYNLDSQSLSKRILKLLD